MDDEEMILKMTRRMLGKKNHQCEFVTNGQEALEAFSKALNQGIPFDLVLLDLTIPGGMGGEKTLQKLQELDPGIIAILSSGYASNIPQNFNACLTKPYCEAELHQAINDALKKHQLPPNK